MIFLTTKELSTTLDRTPRTQNIMLVGKHGIGKSEILSKYFADKGVKVVTLFLGQMSDPGDLIGLPCRDEATGRTNFMPPYWFPVDDQPVALFLDELNRARPEVLQTIMDLALNRRLAGRSLPEGSTVISAVNDGEEYQLTDLDPALVSRFNVYGFRPTKEEWMVWAKSEKLDDRVVEFINENSDWLDGNPLDRNNTDTGLEKTPDRRAWKKVSDVIKKRPDLDSSDSKIIAGIVGTPAASKFLSYAKDNHLLSGEMVLNEFDKVKATVSKYKVHELSIVNDSIFVYIETNYPTMDAKQAAKVAKGFSAYLSLLTQGKRKEALAEFVNTYNSGTYSYVPAFVGLKCPDALITITKFISEL